MTFVSVVLPARNAAGSVGAALASLTAQTHPELEIVAVDDGSTDATLEVMRERAKADSRIRVLSIPHSGVSRAMNAGIEAAQGEYVARMDADDLCHPERISRQARHLDEHPETGVLGCRVAFGGDARAARGFALFVEWSNTLLCHEDISLNRFVELPLVNPTLMFRAEVLRAHGGYRFGDFPEDYELVLRLLEGGVRAAKLPETLFTWNDPPHRLTRTDPRYDVAAFYRVKSGYLARWLARNNPHHPDVWVAGSGRTSRKRLELLTQHGVSVAGYLDVDPRKIGHLIDAVPVVHRKHVPGPDACFVLSYVGSRGAREDIGAFLAARGFELGKSWLPAA